ncbi:MAG TPA: hypothetical protein V6D25_07785 [Leptolyngbyaceae cyanobacterium]
MQWWQNKGRYAVDRLNKIILPFLNTGIDWQFNEQQHKQLKDYYEANKLLASCLKSDCDVDKKIREKIETNLLLPTIQ